MGRQEIIRLAMPKRRSASEGIGNGVLQSVPFFTSFAFSFYIRVRFNETVSVVFRRLNCKIKANDLSLRYR